MIIVIVVIYLVQYLINMGEETTNTSNIINELEM